MLEKTGDTLEKKRPLPREASGALLAGPRKLGPGAWARALGPGPGAQGLGPRPGARVVVEIPLNNDQG